MGVLIKSWSTHCKAADADDADGQVRLILSLGAESKRDSVPGAVEYALPFSSLEDVLVTYQNSSY